MFAPSGTDGQRSLGALRSGVVGAGGTGSAVTEQLARHGVGDLVMLDDDVVVDDTNLTRIHGSTAADLGTTEGKARVEPRDVRRHRNQRAPGHW